MAILEDLLKAIVENTEVTKQLIALRTEAIESVKATAAPATKASATKATTAATTTTTTTAPEPAATGVGAEVYDEIRAIIAGYVSSTDREEERAARKAKIRALLQHDAIKKPGTPADAFDAANIKDDAIDVFKENMAALVAKGDLTEAPKAASVSLV